jgi:hypothetical protein
MPYSNYPKVFNADYSPPQDIFMYWEFFGKTYISDTLEIFPDNLYSTFFDTNSFQRPLTSTKMQLSSNPYNKSTLDPSTLNPSTLNPSTLNPSTLNHTPATNDQPGYRESYFEPPFGQLDYTPGFSLDPAYVNPNEPAPLSPISQSLRTSSMCGDTPEQAYSLSPSPSPRIIKRELQVSPKEQTVPKKAQRKRGRPRLDGLDTNSRATGSSSSKPQRTERLPHNQVERKYREGLNSELERLRKAVPTLPHGYDGGAVDQPRPSKALILSSAINYIRSIEKERDTLRVEIEQVKQSQGHIAGWAGRSNSLDNF